MLNQGRVDDKYFQAVHNVIASLDYPVFILTNESVFFKNIFDDIIRETIPYIFYYSKPAPLLPGHIFMDF